jgi:putative ABC transport system permease protein
VAVGVAAVIVTSAVGTGAQRELLRGMENLGTNLLVVTPAQVKRLVSRQAIRGMVTSLRVEDCDAIADLSDVAEAAPGAEGTLRVKAGGGAMLTSVVGTTPAFPRVRRFRLRAGRFFEADDDRAARRVAVLGARVADTLFPGEDPVGQAIRIRGVPFDIIGVLKAKGSTADGADEDNKLLIPIRTALRRVFNVTWLSTVFVSVRERSTMDDTERAIAVLLRSRHRVAPDGSQGSQRKDDDFAIQNSAKTLRIQRETAESLTQLTTGLAAVALLVGGIGILALMLLSLKERTGEIGLRMAVGARPRDILVQFLLEAAILALGGWAAGALLGGIAAAGIAFGTSWTVAVPVDALLASLGMAATTGIGFGAFPARAASLVPPIQALLAE